MANASLPARSADDTRRGANAILWGLRVAVLLALFDIGLPLLNFPIFDQLGTNYQYSIEHPLYVLFNPGSSGYLGEMVVLVGIFGLALAFPLVLSRRPLLLLGRFRATAELKPTVAASAALTLVFIGWIALVAVLANLTGFNGANTLPLTGPIVFLLLLQAVGSLYAGYCGADGEGADAWRKGALAEIGRAHV